MGVTKRVPGHKIKSLQYFLNRAAVLSLYRDFLRNTKPLAIDVRQDMRRQIRAGFDASCNEEDEQRVRILLREAREQMKAVSNLVDTAVAQQHIATSEYDYEENEWTKFTQKAVASIDTKDTWMDAPLEKNDGKKDVKGRVGIGWPWKTSKGQNMLNLGGIKRR